MIQMRIFEWYILYYTYCLILHAMIKNPFLVTGYLGPEYFCDREDELERLINAVEDRRHTTLVAWRRMGKTACDR